MFSSKDKLFMERAFELAVESFDARYKFIDPNVKINKAVYCFECEYFNSQ